MNSSALSQGFRDMHLSEQLNKKNKKNLFFKHSILIKLFPCQNRNKQKNKYWEIVGEIKCFQKYYIEHLEEKHRANQ